MSRSKPKQLAVRTKLSPAAAVAGAVASSLPPTPSRVPAPPTTSLDNPWKIEKHSVIRKKAVAIVAMRAQGYSTDEIAQELKIRPKSVRNYVYLATKSGFLVNKQGSFFADPKDSIEFELAHKAIRNLHAALDDEPVTIESTGEIKPISKVMYDATMELAHGALFKQFDPPKESASLPGMQVLAIKIDMPTTGDTTVREGSMGGSPIYEGSVNDVDQSD